MLRNADGSYDETYTITNEEKAVSVFVASPSANNTTDIMRVYGNSGVFNTPYVNGSGGFRPIVCLQPNVKLEEQTDGNFIIK